jgi:hypothetical protein
LQSPGSKVELLVEQGKFSSALAGKEKVKNPEKRGDDKTFIA